MRPSLPPLQFLPRWVSQLSKISLSICSASAGCELMTGAIIVSALALDPRLAELKIIQSGLGSTRHLLIDYQSHLQQDMLIDLPRNIFVPNWFRPPFLQAATIAPQPVSRPQAAVPQSSSYSALNERMRATYSNGTGPSTRPNGSMV